ncbi:MAG: enoyl-CoA hydratase/isomerase family protein [Acidobacteriota bacterium]
MTPSPEKSAAIALEWTGPVATLELRRPPLHILDLATLGEMDTALASLAGADSAPQVLVVQASGERAFSAGVAVQDHTPDRIEEMLATFHGALHRLRALPAVSIAAVRGACLGGGMELAASCDLVVATEDAVFGQPEIRLGCFPPWAAALYPPRIGTHRTLELLLTGRTLNATEAHRWGLINRLVPTADLPAAVAELTAEITAMSAAVTPLVKRAVRTTEGNFAHAVGESERLYLEELARCEDMHEGIAAFMEKRAPDWKHR